MTVTKPVKKIHHIVLADDDADKCVLFKEALSDLKVPYVFTLARNCEILLTLLDEHDFSPDFIFLDLRIPGLASEDCLKVIKTHKKLDAVPVILYSESVNPDDKDYCYDDQASEYFLKALSFLL